MLNKHQSLRPLLNEPEVQKFILDEYSEFFPREKYGRVTKGALRYACRQTLRIAKYRQCEDSYSERVRRDIHDKDDQRPDFTVIIFAVLLDDKRLFKKLLCAYVEVESDHYQVQVDGWISREDRGPYPTYENLAARLPGLLKYDLQDLPEPFNDQIRERLRIMGQPHYLKRCWRKASESLRTMWDRHSNKNR